MGSSNSKVLEFSDELKNLKNELQNLKEMDKNNDGIITKDEFLSWKNLQKTNMEKLEQKIEQRVNEKYSELLSKRETELQEASGQIQELSRQIESLKTMNSALEKELSQKQSGHNALNTKVQLQELSQQKIDEFVEKLLSDKNVNIGYFPDFVERKLYKNIFTLLLGILDNTLATTSINFMGHQLMLTMAPQMNQPVVTSTTPQIKQTREIIVEETVEETIDESI